MVKFTKTMKVGDGHEDGVALGPIQNSLQYERVKGFFTEIEEQKQKVVVGGTVEKSKGYFISPTIIDKPDESSRLVREEPFGTSYALTTALEVLTFLLQARYCLF